MVTFSHRTPSDMGWNDLTKIVEEKKRSGISLVDLTVSNPTAVGIAYPIELLEALKPTEQVFRYDPHPRGRESARRAISENWEQTWLTSSTSEAYSYVFKLLGDPGDEVLVPTPSYPLFDSLLDLEGLKKVAYRLEHDGGWRVDHDSVRASISPRTKAIVVVHPNNPTGHYVSLDDRDFLSSLNIPLIVDEVFLSFSLEENVSFKSWSTEPTDGLVFVLSGLSKRFGLPQLKLSWISVRGNEEVLKSVAPRLDWIADTYLSVASPIQQAVPALFEAGETIAEKIVSRIRENHLLLKKICPPGSALECLPNEAGWSAILRLPDDVEEEKFVLTLAESANILIHPGYYFDLPFPASIVISLLTPGEILSQGMEIIQSRVT